VDIVATGGNLFINDPIRSLAAGNAIVIAAPGNAIVNSAGGTALVAPNGRWLVYSTSPAGSTEDGLVAAAGGTTPRLYNRPYATNLPASIAGTDNHLVYSNPQALDITANNQSRAYGAANPALTFTATGLVTDDGVTDTLAGALATGATAASSVAGGPYAITQGTLGAAGGYSVSFTAGQLTVTAVPLAVTANDAMRRQGEPNPAFNSSYAGFVLGETPASLGGALAFATPATPASAPGSYAITPLGLTSSNYSIAFVDGTLTVVSAPAPAAPQQPQVPVSVVQQAYIDTLAAIQGNRAATAVPVHFQELVTIENGGMRLPAGLKP
jgi:hypothetical protein